MVKTQGGKEFEPMTSGDADNNSIFLDTTDSEIKIKNNNGATQSFAIQVPIGSIISWAKTITGVPALPANFIECDGVGTITSGPMTGQGVPDLNTTQRFLRGATTSGGTGGSSTHTHTITQSQSAGSGVGSSGIAKATSTNATSTLPSYYQVVFIMRIE